MKNNLKKRILSLFLSVMMVIGMIPTASLTAFAADCEIKLASPGGPPAFISSVTVKNVDGPYTQSGTTYTFELESLPRSITLEFKKTVLHPSAAGGPGIKVNGQAVNSTSKTINIENSMLDSENKYSVKLQRTFQGSNIGEEITLVFKPKVVIPVTGIELAKTASVNAKEQIALSPTITPSDTTSVLHWESSDTNVATVDQSGNVTGVSPGTATITAAADGVAATCEVTVNNVAVNGIAIVSKENGEEVSKIDVAVGYTNSDIKAKISPDNATNMGIVWSSSDENVATVDAEGVITALSEGTATITATTEGTDANGQQLAATCEVKVVTVPVTGISLNKQTAQIEIGQSETLTVIFDPEQSTNKNVVWSSSDETVATVDANGVVTGIKATEENSPVIITATTEDGGKTAKCAVTVVKVPVSSIILSETVINEFYTYTAKQLTASVLPENATNKNVTWTSSDETVATVDQNGLVKALAAGTATITAKSVDNDEISAQCTVNITYAAENVVMLNLQKGNGSVDYVTFTNSENKPLDIVSKDVVKSGSVYNINLILPKKVSPTEKITATFTLRQDNGLPWLTRSNTATGTGTAVNNKTNVYSINLANGYGTATAYLYNIVSPGATSNTYETIKINYTVVNNIPQLKGEASKDDILTAGEQYTVDLTDKFTDKDEESLTYKVSVDGGAYTAFEGTAYTYTQDMYGSHTLAFKATDGQDDSEDVYTVNLEVKNSDILYDVNVKVPDAVAPSFYITKEFDSNGFDVLGSQLEAVKGTSENGFTLYTVKVPKNISRISYRGTTDEGVTNWGGMSFATKTEGTPIADIVTLRQMQGVIKTLINGETPDAANVQFKVQTHENYWAVNGGTGVDNTYKQLYYRYLLVASGNEATYTYYTKTTGTLANTYGENRSTERAVYDDSASIDINVLPLVYKSTFTITAPKDADVKMFRQYKNYNVAEVAVTRKTEQNDGTVEWMFIKPTSDDSMSYRVSMEGKVTKAGYIKGDAIEGDGITVEWDDSDIAPTDRVEYDTSTVWGSRAEDSIYLNVNERNNLALDKNGTYRLRAYRIWQIINSDTMNKMIEPDFTYSVKDIKGSGVVSITPVTNKNGNAKNNWLDIKAKNEGVAVVEIGYDALKIISGNQTTWGSSEAMNQFTYGAVDPARKGLVVVQVGNKATDVNFGIYCNSKFNNSARSWDAELDTVYFFGDKGQISFKPTVTSGSISEVAVSKDNGTNWQALAAENDVYTADIYSGNNIIRIKKSDGTEAYQVVRGDKISYTLTDDDGDNIIEAGDKVTLKFHGMHAFVAKFSGIYNPGRIVINYKLGDKEMSSMDFSAYNFVGNANVVLEIPQTAQNGQDIVYTDGSTSYGWYNSAPGKHRTLTDDGIQSNLQADQATGVRNIIEDITLTVGQEISAGTGSEPSENTAPALKNGVNTTGDTAIAEVGSKYSINLKNIFTDAENDNLTYKVKVNGTEYDVQANYTYIPAAVGEYKLVFTANDGNLDSESYTVTLTATEAAQVNPELKFDIEDDDIAGYVTISVEDNAVRLESEIDGINPLYQKPLGTIIKPVKVPFAAYDTIAEVTLRLFKAMDINVAHGGTAYSNFYISSIGNFVINDLYYEAMGEYSAGQGSGWMITWNTNDGKGDWFINKGASDFAVNDGDIIKWKYTCQYGADIGDKGYLEEAKDAEKLIAAIGTPITSESEAAINEARSAYDALVPAQKAAVSNYDVLVAAEKSLALLKATDEDKAAAETVNGLIAAIGTVTKDSKAAIEAARVAYNSLENDVQKQLCDIETLETAENLYKQLINGEKLEKIYNATGSYMASLGTPAVGTTGGEWMVIGLARGNKGLDAVTAQGYLNGVLQYMENEFSKNADLKTAVRLDANKSTDNSRVILALTAAGFDATNVGGYNLFDGLDSMEYIGRQGINGPIWALIALNSHPSYENELSGDVTEEKLIEAILSAQLDDSGWDLANTAADADLTAMAVQALAPYYDSNAKVKEAVDKALSKLSSMQQSDGSFASIDGKNSESIAQVIVALTALGIDPEQDTRFIKKGMSPVDALCEYAVSGGGFMHTPDTQLDGMSTEQGYYALVSYFRLLNPNQTSLYDMSDVTLKKGVYDDKVASAYDYQVANEAEKLISDIGEVKLENYSKIEKARKAYDKLTDKQKKLVDNYNKLLEAEDEAVDQVEDLIDKIGEVGYDSATDVEAAKKAYNYLPEYLQKKVSNSDKLENAEVTLKDLRAEALELIANGKLVLSKSELLELKGNFEEITENTGYDAVLALVRTYARLGEKQQLALKDTNGLKLAQQIIAAYNHEDASTGIKTDGLEWNIRLVVEDTDGNTAETAIVEAIENSTVLELWNIYLEDVITGEKYIADKAIRIKVPAALLGDWEAYDELCVVHYTDDGEIEVLKCITGDEYISFNAAEFSIYAVVGMMEENSQTENHPAFTVPSGTETGADANANSGWIIWVIIAAVGVAALAGIIVLKKRTENEE